MFMARIRAATAAGDGGAARCGVKEEGIEARPSATPRVSSCAVYLVAAFLAMGSLSCDATQVTGDSEEISAVVGGISLLPCDIRPPLPNDSVILVIWFKNEITPIYSYDIRGKHSELASHWRDKELLQQRGYFRTITEPATLALDDVRAEDEGDYRCRVDFRRSPTRNYKVRLNVIVPPQTPTIIDERGRELPSVAGPYTEGSTMKLTCVVRGGRPPPSVKWWRGERLLETVDLPSPFPEVRQSQLLVPSLARVDLHAIFTCQAYNSKLAPPASARVSLEMHLRPLTAAIANERTALSAGRRVEVDCISGGSRPAAKLSWWLDNQALVGSVDKVLHGGNITASTLRLTPSMADNGRALTCRAQNPAMPAGVEEDTWRINVQFEPVLRLQLGSSLNPDDIEEGDDVYFECKVHANPWVYKVVWRHDGREIHHNPKGGVLLINHDLALQGVRREQAGNYSCSASNVEGDGESNVVPLRVMYAPICREEQRRVFAVGRLEAAHVTCHVDSFPPPDSYRWSFNHTALGMESPVGAGVISGAESGGETLSYAPVSELDYGTLLCAAANAAGRQREPCVFHIVPAGRPEPPINCSLANATAGALQVECEEGFDGGLPQRFLLEVYDLDSGLLVANVTSSQPHFLALGLRGGRALRAMAYAFNAKGRSESFALEGFTLQGAERRTGSPAALELTPMLATMFGSLAALLAVGTAVATAVRLRADGRGGGGPARPVSLALKEKALAASAAGCVGGGGTGAAIGEGPEANAGAGGDRGDDRNPDVIPCNTDSELGCAETPGPTQALLPPRGAGAAASQRNGDVRGTFKGGGGHSTLTRAPPSHRQTDVEAQYTELRLVRSPSCLSSPPGTLPSSSPDTLASSVTGALYAPSPMPTIGGPTQRWGLPTSHSQLGGCREVVTVRTPLMAGECAQESCV